jgi:hypothetical protein
MLFKVLCIVALSALSCSAIEPRTVTQGNLTVAWDRCCDTQARGIEVRIGTANPATDAFKITLRFRKFGRTKRMVLAQAGLELSRQQAEALAALAATRRASAEAAEGLASFEQKRDPAWYRPPEQEA